MEMLSIWTRRTKRIKTPSLIKDGNKEVDMIGDESVNLKIQNQEKREKLNLIEVEKKEMVPQGDGETLHPLNEWVCSLQTQTVLHLRNVQQKLERQISEQEEELKSLQDELLQVHSYLCLFGNDILELHQQYHPNDTSALSPMMSEHSNPNQTDESFTLDDVSQYLSALMATWTEVKASISSVQLQEATVIELNNQLQTKLTDERITFQKEIEELRMKLVRLEQDHQELLLSHQQQQLQLEQQQQQQQQQQKEQQEQQRRDQLQEKLQRKHNNGRPASEVSSAPIPPTTTKAITTYVIPAPEFEAQNELILASIQSSLLILSRELLELSVMYQGKVPNVTLPSINITSSNGNGITINPTIIADYLSSLLQLWPDVKRSILTEHQELGKKEQEHREILQQLIECKLRVAVVTTELDSEKKRSSDLQREARRNRVYDLQKQERNLRKSQSDPPLQKPSNGKPSSLFP